MKLTKAIREGADQIITIKSTDDLRLKNMALRIATAELNHNGFYTCTIAGVKTLFILEKT